MRGHLTRSLVALTLVVVACGEDPPLSVDGSGSGGESTGTDSGPPLTSTSEGVDVSGTQDTGVPPGCGNGIREGEEQCDDEDESAMCDADCSLVECGDDYVNTTAGEECEGTNLLAGSCESLGFDGGTLVCTPACAYDSSGCGALPDEPVLMLGFSAVKQFEFGWAAVDGAEHYLLEERAAPGEPFVQVGGEIIGESISVTMPLCFRQEASYRLQACNAIGCVISDPVAVEGSLAEAVGYVKASNTSFGDGFGLGVASSADGSTLAVGAFGEDGGTTGIGGDETLESAPGSGAVYVLVRDARGQWSQQAYVKASNTNADDFFGQRVVLSADGNTLAVTAIGEDSSATGIDGDELDDGAPFAGAVYVFVRDGLGQWSQQAYVKASNTDGGDSFGAGLALSGDGNTLAVGAHAEDSGATGIDGDQADDAAITAGAAYVFVRDGLGQWSQQAYVKASNTDQYDLFGTEVALASDGNTLAVGAPGERSSATGIDGDDADDSLLSAGAVYVFVRDGLGQWSQQAYVKASNTDFDDAFGESVALAPDGNTLAVGATGEDSAATGIDGNQSNQGAPESGAVYVLVRDGLGQWSQQAYVKGSNTEGYDTFGGAVALGGAGDVLAVAAPDERSNAIGIGGDEASDALPSSGAVYVLVRDGMGQWSQRAYVKASNPQVNDQLGSSVALSADTNTLAVGAGGEDGAATGIDGDQGSNGATDAGAVYLY